MTPKNDNLDATARLALDLQLALYLDRVAVLEKAGVVSYRQMSARVLSISRDAHDDGETALAQALEGVAKGFAGHGDGLSIDLMKSARDVRDDEALGDMPHRPQDD